MTDTLTDWRPIHEAHSIQAAGLTISFTQALTEIPWRKVMADGRTTARKFGLIVERSIPTFMMSVGPEAGFPPMAQPATMPVPMVSGIELMRLRTPTFFEEKVTYDATSLRYESWSYTRWGAFLDRALDLIEGVLPHYLASVPILSIATDYFDKFISVEGVEVPDARQVVDFSSPVLAHHAMKPTEPWHSHCGWFERIDDCTKRLFNVDTDVGDALARQPHSGKRSQARVLQVRTAVVDHFNQPGLLETSNEQVTIAFTRDRLQMLHDELKKVLMSVLTQEAAVRIELKGVS